MDEVVDQLDWLDTTLNAVIVLASAIIITVGGFKPLLNRGAAKIASKQWKFITDFLGLGNDEEKATKGLSKAFAFLAALLISTIVMLNQDIDLLISHPHEMISGLDETWRYAGSILLVAVFSFGGAELWSFARTILDWAKAQRDIKRLLSLAPVSSSSIRPE